MQAQDEWQSTGVIILDPTTIVTPPSVCLADTGGKHILAESPPPPRPRQQAPSILFKARRLSKTPG